MWVQISPGGFPDQKSRRRSCPYRRIYRRKKRLYETLYYRMTCPGLGMEVGATPGINRSLYQDFPCTDGYQRSFKRRRFAANIYEKLGFPVVPNSTEPRQDIIQAVTLGTPEGLVAFCQGIQAAAPVDSFVTPEPWDMPGYDSQVIMAAGAFIQGSSIELSAMMVYETHLMYCFISELVLPGAC